MTAAPRSHCSQQSTCRCGSYRRRLSASSPYPTVQIFRSFAVFSAHPEGLSFTCFIRASLTEATNGEYRVESHGIIAQRCSTTALGRLMPWFGTTTHRSCWNRPRLIGRWLQRLWILWTATAALTIFIGAMFCSGGTSWGQRMKHRAHSTQQNVARRNVESEMRNAKCKRRP